MTKLYICSVCGHPIIADGVCNCPFCGAHMRYVNPYKSGDSKWRCTVCNNLFDKVPKICPICSASPDKFVKFDDQPSVQKLPLGKTDKANAEKALDIEVSNSTFYFCAAAKSDKDYERKLFRALGKVEFEHAEIWQTVLGQKTMPKSSDSCVAASLKNLKEAHRREDAAIKFYAKAATESENERIKLLFLALVEIEKDHLNMHEKRIGLLKRRGNGS